MSKSLVTGGAGFLGSHLADELLRRGHDVTVVDDLSGGFRENVPDGARFVKASICDPVAMGDLFTHKKFDCVFHLAAYAAEGLSHFIRRFNYENNLLGSVNLINESVRTGVKRFVFTSSMAVYGSAEPPFIEDMTPAPEDPYGVAKFAVEQDLKAAHDLFGLEYTIFRPHNIYGTRQNIWDRFRNVVGIFIRQAMAGEPLTIFGDGEQVRAFSHVSDVVPCLADCVEMPATAGQTYNVGGEVPITINVLADIVAAQFERIEWRHLPERHEVKFAFCDHEKAKRAFKWTPQVALAAGLKEMVAWAQGRSGAPTPLPCDVELTEGLPKVWAEMV